MLPFGINSFIYLKRRRGRRKDRLLWKWTLLRNSNLLQGFGYICVFSSLLMRKKQSSYAPKHICHFLACSKIYPRQQKLILELKHNAHLRLRFISWYLWGTESCFSMSDTQKISAVLANSICHQVKGLDSSLQFCPAPSRYFASQPLPVALTYESVPSGQAAV